MSDEGTKKKKDRDPIFATCFVVFVIACVAVLGSYVYGEFVETDDTKIAYGDTVTVNYTGTFYAYYGEDNAVVFNTTLTSVDESDCAKSNSYSASTGTIEVTVGDGDYLSLFENCLVGHQTGDTVYVEIPVGMGYNAPSGSSYTASTDMTFNVVETVTYSAFTDMYEDVELTGGQSVVFTTIYGWEATATYSTADNTVTVINMPEDGATYTYGLTDDEDETETSGITLTVSNVSGGTFAVALDFGDVTYVDGTEIQMIEIVIDGATVYVTNLDTSAGTFTYKTCEERYNITLYFVIEIVSIE